VQGGQRSEAAAGQEAGRRGQGLRGGTREVWEWWEKCGKCWEIGNWKLEKVWKLGKLGVFLLYLLFWFYLREGSTFCCVSKGWLVNRLDLLLYSLIFLL
jgi:hypothetical protein